MSQNFEIKGGAGEFEAAIIAIVLDRLAAEEKALLEPGPDSAVPAWVRALDPESIDPFGGSSDRPAIQSWRRDSSLNSGDRST